MAGLALATLTITLAGCSSAEVDETARDDAGTVTSAGTLGVTRLQVGDCVDLGDAASQEDALVDAFQGVPCGELHDGEVYLADTTFFTGADDAFPGDESLARESEEACGPAFEDFIGESYETTELDFGTITPTEDTWSTGDRALVCVAYKPTADGAGTEKVTGSLKG